MHGRRATVNLVRGIACGLFLAAFHETCNAQTCPLSCIPVRGCSTEPHGSFSDPAEHGTGSSSGAYWLHLGHLECGGYWSATDIVTSDWFVVEQAPSAAPFALAIEMKLNIGLYYARGDGRVTIPGKGEVQVHCETPWDVAYGGCSETRSFDFTVALGDTFTVNALCAGGNTGFMGSYNVSLDYALRLVPPGVRIRSCQGFVVDTVVPSRRVSWGRLKRHYR